MTWMTIEFKRAEPGTDNLGLIYTASLFPLGSAADWQLDPWYGIGIYNNLDI